MENKKIKRSAVRIYSFIGALFLVLAVTAITGNVQSHKYKREVLLSQQRALTELDGYLTNISTSLQKGMYANTPTMIDSMATELSREALAAKSSLSALPLGDTNLEYTYKFLSQVGEFVQSLNRKAAAGENITDEERKNLYALISFADTLSKDVSTIRSDMFSGNFSFTDEGKTLAASTEEMQSLSTDMEDTEQSLTDYPSLIYDGPFSDHINSLNPKMLENKEEISQETAAETAAKFIGCKVEELSFVCEEDDNTASYCFSYGSKAIAVTRKGGYVLYVLDSSFIGEAKLSYEDALKSAEEFLAQNGYKNMEESYYSISDGLCLINFAYSENGVKYYPDLIKVGISLNDGSALTFDARGFVMNHTERNFGEPKISEDKARESVSPILTVIGSQKAVIPTDSKGEKFCWEFHCKAENGTEVLVYIDTETGYEDDILLLAYSDGGVLTK